MQIHHKSLVTFRKVLLNRGWSYQGVKETLLALQDNVSRGQLPVVNVNGVSCVPDLKRAFVWQDTTQGVGFWNHLYNLMVDYMKLDQSV